MASVDKKTQRSKKKIKKKTKNRKKKLGKHGMREEITERFKKKTKDRKKMLCEGGSLRNQQHASWVKGGPIEYEVSERKRNGRRGTDPGASRCPARKT